jgi:hypothetical protein
MKLDERTAVLVAIGSAAAVNCAACQRSLADRAAAMTVDEAEAAAARQIGLRVSRAAGNTAAAFAPTAPGPRPTGVSASAAGGSDNGCCGAPNERGS